MLLQARVTHSARIYDLLFLSWENKKERERERERVCVGEIKREIEKERDRELNKSGFTIQNLCALRIFLQKTRKFDPR